jgi:hypothetical protein
MVNDEKCFDYFLQRNMAFILDDKVIKKGKLVLVVKKDYYYVFSMYIDGVLKKIEYPYPFIINEHGNGLSLNYHLTSLGIGNYELYYRYLALNRISNSKLYDRIMRFEIVDTV